MRDADLQEIRALPLFRDMGEAPFADLMRGAYHQNFPAQVTLIEEGRPADFLHIVTDGAVELFARWSNRETTLAVARPVSTFILAACINDAPYLMSARTMTSSRIAMVPGADLRAAFLKDAAFAQAIVGELAGCYRSVVRHAKNIKLRSSKERLAAFLIGEAEKAGQGSSFELPFEKRILASYLGMTPENLSRALKQLKDEGVMVDGATVRFHDVDRIRAIAMPGRLMDECV
ncbi:helix-turn-helix domain-containing protein [Defluviimonas sp. WL0002]|uniref:Helix-turn-helix domain-containing protein n=1 Tax=Albidovulum marisflavi TaxID=2984159 RepID=A0ABT2ZD70_9RHOB|nr:helix-turn-helix domain-containing protein [Defluviimonas sp. WL0002]MCV2869069.1 helix-turn-helix domain-containing protein [Defluviimonas sp. WL0002]